MLYFSPNDSGLTNPSSVNWECCNPKFQKVNERSFLTLTVVSIMSGNSCTVYSGVHQGKEGKTTILIF